MQPQRGDGLCFMGVMGCNLGARVLRRTVFLRSGQKSLIDMEQRQTLGTQPNDWLPTCPSTSALSIGSLLGFGVHYSNVQSDICTSQGRTGPCLGMWVHRGSSYAQGFDRGPPCVIREYLTMKVTWFGSHQGLHFLSLLPALTSSIALSCHLHPYLTTLCFPESTYP